MHHALPQPYDAATISWVPAVIGVGAALLVLAIVVIIGYVKFLRNAGLGRK